jgi:hypothetical protein
MAQYSGNLSFSPEKIQQTELNRGHYASLLSVDLLPKNNDYLK